MVTGSFLGGCSNWALPGEAETKAELAIPATIMKNMTTVRQIKRSIRLDRRILPT